MKNKEYKAIIVKNNEMSVGQGITNSKKNFKKYLEKKGYKVIFKSIKEIEIFDFIQSEDDFNLLSKIYNNKDMEDYKNIKKKYPKIFSTRILDRDSCIRFYNKIIATCFIKRKKSELKVDFFELNIETNNSFGKCEYINDLYFDISINLNLHISETVYKLYDTIAHELAHCVHMRHSRQHRQLTNKFLRQILENTKGEV